MTYRERIRSARRLADELEAARAWMSKAFDLLSEIERAEFLPRPWRDRARVLIHVALDRSARTYPAGPDRSRSISLLRAIAKDLEDVVAKNVELTKGPGRNRMVEALRKRAAEERELAAKTDAVDPGGSVDNPHPGTYAAGVLEAVANEIEGKTNELRRGGW